MNHHPSFSYPSPFMDFLLSHSLHSNLLQQIRSLSFTFSKLYISLSSFLYMHYFYLTFFIHSFIIYVLVSILQLFFFLSNMLDLIKANTSSFSITFSTLDRIIWYSNVLVCNDAKCCVCLAPCMPYKRLLKMVDDPLTWREGSQAGSLANCSITIPQTL